MCIRDRFPVLSVYSYQAYSHYVLDKSLYIHNPQPELSTAENILYMLRPDSKYTDLESHILDLALVLHAEHGGGNNSTFTTHVVTSSGTDTYSTIAAALGSLKGPKHGGANIKVVQMFEDMKKQLPDWSDEDAVRAHLKKLLNKEAFDGAGLIYGMGHAVYSLSDPRANMFKNFVEKLAMAKGREDEYRLYSAVERLAPQVIAEAVSYTHLLSAGMALPWRAKVPSTLARRVEKSSLSGTSTASWPISRLPSTVLTMPPPLVWACLVSAVPISCLLYTSRCV